MDRPDEPSFPDALRQAIEKRGLSLDRISAHLRARGHTVSIATLSYWQSGRSVPSRSASIRALGALEAVLDVDRGRLARWIAVGAPEAVSAPAVRMADVDTQMAAIDEIVSSMGRRMDDGIRIVAAHWRPFVDERGAIRYGHVREVVRAVVHEVDSYVTSAWHPVAGQEVVITPLAGCAVRRMVTQTRESVCVAELRLPPIANGGVHTVEYEIGFPVTEDSIPCNRAIACVTAPMRELVVSVSFPPDAVPTSIHLVEGASAVDEPVRTPLSPRVAMTLARQDFGPGLIGFEWDPPPPGESTDQAPA